MEKYLRYVENTECPLTECPLTECPLTECPPYKNDKYLLYVSKSRHVSCKDIDTILGLWFFEK